MDLTLEVRWFVDGPVPDDVAAWFAHATGAAPESERADLYLVSDDPALNAKLREGKLQLKRRGGRRVPVTFAPEVVGYRERWHKWSFRIKTKKSPDLEAHEPTGLWLRVEKTRDQRTFAPEEQAGLLAARDLPVLTPTPAEAAAELTRVRLVGDDGRVHEAWTICVEAEGPRDLLTPTLQQMGAYVFAPGTPPALGLTASHGYAGWLTRVAASVAASVAGP